MLRDSANGLGGRAKERMVYLAAGPQHRTLVFLQIYISDPPGLLLLLLRAPLDQFNW